VERDARATQNFGAARRLAGEDEHHRSV
jgi:hypothetical protein